MRGTEVALFDYAYFNQTILNNKSYITAPSTSELSSFKKFSDKFEVLIYDNFSEVEEFIDNRDIDIFYSIKSGDKDNVLVNNAKNVVHAVFDSYDTHGDVYAYVSEYLANKIGGGSLYVPHIINLPDTNNNLREELGIPKDAIVFGRYGGEYEFNIDYVKEAIQDIVVDRDDIYFLFMSTDPFYEHNKIIHLPKTFDVVRKREFINTCDCMIHARTIGETFGIAIGEFLYCDKPVMTSLGVDTSHIDILNGMGLLYDDKTSVYNLMNTFEKKDEDGKYKQLVEGFSSDNVMKKFNDIFIVGDIDRGNRMSILEKDLVVGTFTHRLDKLPLLLESLKKYYPDVLFIPHYDDKLISPNMEALRQKFISSGKRYWLFLDDDVQFVNSTLIPNALETLVSNNYGGVCCYECITNRWVENDYDIKRLSTKDMNWMIGYFMLVDSKKVGDISCNRNTPDKSSMDIHYSLDIRMKGYRVGLAPDYLYHFAKPQYRNKEELNKLMQDLWRYFSNTFPKDFYERNASQFSTRLFDYDLQQQAEAIMGLTTEDELKWLGQTASWKFSILEVGTYLGRSAKILANTAGTVYTIDKLLNNWLLDGTSIDNKDQQKVIENNLFEEINRGKIHTLYGDSISFEDYFKENNITFDMLWLDGDHEYDTVINELKVFMPFVNDEYSIICGHDIDYKPVEDAVRDFFGSYEKYGETIWFVHR